MQREIVHTPLPRIENFRYARDWFRIELAVTHDPQPTRAFRNQDAAIREESESVRIVETSQRDDPESRSGDSDAAGPTGGAIENQRPVEGRSSHDELSRFLLCRERGQSPEK
jgi:hypothetical protein